MPENIGARGAGDHHSTAGREVAGGAASSARSSWPATADSTNALRR